MPRFIDGNAVFLFGPQALSFDESAFQHLRSTILKRKGYGWVLDAIADLTGRLESIIHGCPALLVARKSAQSRLEDLQRWFLTGKTSTDVRNLPNTLLSPLVVIMQLVEFVEYQKISNSRDRREEDVLNMLQPDAETLGMCIGFLSAIVVSCSTNRESFEKFGTVAIQLAMIIGMVVDIQNESDQGGPAKSLATIWRSANEKQKMLEIMGSFPDVSPHSSNPGSDRLVKYRFRHTYPSLMMRAEQQ